jgi:Protein of unknown function (DUF1367)
MSRFTIHRTNMALPDERGLEGARTLLFKALDGFGQDDKKSWRRLWKRMIGLEPGEMCEVQMVFPRSGPFHRRHMAIEQKVFDAQEKFEDFESFRTWLKIGAAWVIWAPGEDGTLIPVPKSISYAAADEDEFHRYHEAVVRFLRGPHAGVFLWPHLEDKAINQIDYILRGFGE